MFGPKLRIEFDGFGVSLVPPKLEWAGYYAEMMSSAKVNQYTHALYGFTEADEVTWMESTSKDPGKVVWAIVPDGSDIPVGSTGLHDIDSIGQSCVSGIIIFDSAWWYKGVASRAHLVRTRYAADTLARLTIRSEVRAPNEWSRKALERVGYSVTGITPRSTYRSGQYLDTLLLTWLHPEKVDLLYPEGVPEEYLPALERAKIALEKARNTVQIL